MYMELMDRRINSSGLFLILILLVATTLMIAVTPVNAGEGNNLPSGKHYTLNILGKSRDKGDYATTPPGDDNFNPETKSDSGHRIFVKLGPKNGDALKTRIMLQEDIPDEPPEGFAVIDADGTDGKAVFQLPAPGDVIDPTTGEYDPSGAEYYVFIKVLYPKGKANMTTGVWTDIDNNVWIMSEETLYLNQAVPSGKNGKSILKGQQFEDVTKELTTIIADFDEDPTTPSTRIAIFDDTYQYYFWDYDNMGLKHVQLRFYLVEDINRPAP